VTIRVEFALRTSRNTGAGLVGFPSKRTRRELDRTTAGRGVKPKTKNVEQTISPFVGEVNPWRMEKLIPRSNFPEGMRVL
jgi:hypothetical protein